MQDPAPHPATATDAITLGELRPRSRVDVLLSGVRPSDENADRWLIQLRWVAITGMSATVFVAAGLVPMLDVGPIATMLGVIAIANMGWTLAVRLRPKNAGSAPIQGNAAIASGARYVAMQLFSDVLALASILWFAGGVENPFAVFLAFQIAIAGLLCTPRMTLAIATFTVACVLVLTKAPPLPLQDEGGEGGAVAHLASVASILSVSAFLAVFVSMYAQRLDVLRRQSVQNEKLALLGRLVGSMSHELSTPLATVLLASHDLNLALGDGDLDDAKQLARTLEAEAQRASDIIGVVRGELRPDLKREPVELGGFVRARMDEELDQLGFSGERVYQIPFPVTAMVLKPALRQVFTNLITNAVEACARGSSPPAISVCVERIGRLAEVTVSDSGPGFSHEILPRLGEPFQSTKEQQGGMGLGLYVSATLARRMNAVLRAENATLGGARVTLSILLGPEA